MDEICMDEILRSVCKCRYNDGVYILYDYNKKLINNMIRCIASKGIASKGITTNDLINRFNKIQDKILKCKRQIDFNCEVFMEIYKLYILVFLSKKVFFNENILEDMIKKYKESQMIDINEEIFIKVFEVCDGDESFVVYNGWRRYILKYKNIFLYDGICILPRERYFSYEVAGELLKNLEDILDDYKNFIYK